MKKVILAVLLVLLLTFGFISLKVYVLGQPINDEALAVRVEEGDGQITLYMQTTDSAKAISNIQYRYEGTAMHLTVYGVLSSPLHSDGDKCLYYEILDETEVWVGNRLVWTAE